jgi:L-serine dehydratase
MEMINRTLYRQTHAMYEENIHKELNPFEPNYAEQWSDYIKSGKAISNSLNVEILKLVFAVNAKLPGIKVVPGPMGTGGGYLYAALFSVCKMRGYRHEDLLRGLFIAAGVGSISYSRFSPTGEAMGCAGECGVCCAMTAAAIVEMAGGTPVQVESAASFAMQSFIGSPCDPISGGFEHPCLSRITKAAVMAVVYADMALAGLKAVLPYHEVFDIAAKAGENFAAEMVCQEKGACCVCTPTAKRLTTEFKEWNKKNGLAISQV